MPPLRLVVFDFDGTLADSFPWTLGAMNEAADLYGFRRIEPHEVEDLRAYDNRQLVAHLGVSWWKLARVVRYVRRRMAQETERISLFPGVPEALRRLAGSGVGLAILTTNSEENVRLVLGPEAAALFGAWECGVPLFGKRRRLRRLLRRAGVAPPQALCVGDETRDLEAARAEGVAFGAVEWGFAAPAALRARAPEMTFATVAEMAERLAGLSG